MPSWGDLSSEINDLLRTDQKEPLGFMYGKYMSKLHQYTKRNTILYTTRWTTSPNFEGETSLTDEDMLGFMETVYGLDGGDLDLILHSPGGSAEAAESIVMYLREKFDNIRVIVPHAAMSAATMLACAADSIVMGKESSLGPIDPQVPVSYKFGTRFIPAQAIIDDFESAKNIYKELDDVGVWGPILKQFYPGMLQQCITAKVLAQELVEDWLEKYMFKGENDAKSKANQIAITLSSHDVFKSHSRHISKKWAKNMGLKISNLEDDHKLQDLVLSVFHISNIVFQKTQIIKFINNHNGRAYVKYAQPHSKHGFD